MHLQHWSWIKHSIKPSSYGWTQIPLSEQLKLESQSQNFSMGVDFHLVSHVCNSGKNPFHPQSFLIYGVSFRISGTIGISQMKTKTRSYEKQP